MKTFKKITIVLAALLALGSTTWAGSYTAAGKLTSESAASWPSRGPLNLVDRLERMGNFSILLTALETAGLKDTVAKEGPFTLFAPTDEAFADLLQQLGATPEELLAREDLSDILLYHVAPGTRRAFQLLAASTQPTLSGGNPVLVVFEGNGILVNRSKVTRANVSAKNGVIHVIDKVLLPPAEPIVINSMLDVLELDGRFSVLLAALDVTGLDGALASPGPFTLFAPTDEAFTALLAELGATPEQLLANPDLEAILKYHVLGSRERAFDLVKDRDVTTLLGEQLTVSLRRFGIYVNDARVVNPNVNTPNGIIHSIDKVLLP